MRQSRHLEVIVEGDGDQVAAGILIERIARRVRPDLHTKVGNPWKLPKTKITGDDHALRHALDVLAKPIKRTPGGILVIWDADDDCPFRDGPAQFRRIQALRTDIPIGVVIAKREYEAWFLAAASSLAGHGSLLATLADHPQPESPRDAKGWLSDQMPPGRRYREREHQPLLSRVLDIDLARRRSRSFDKCCREVLRLLNTADQVPG
jgi:hypothetical protein